MKYIAYNEDRSKYWRGTKVEFNWKGQVLSGTVVQVNPTDAVVSSSMKRYRVSYSNMWPVE